MGRIFCPGGWYSVELAYELVQRAQTNMDRISKAIRQANKSRTASVNQKNVVGDFDLAHGNRVEVPKSLLESNKIVAGALTGPEAEYYRMLRTKTLRILSQNNWRVIGVTGPSSSSGKSLTAANLAVAISMTPNYSALLVDADMRKSTVSKMFGLNPDFGLSEFLSWKASLEEVVICPGIDDLGIIVNTHPMQGGSDLLLSDALSALVEQIKSSDENLVAIFDLPPVFVGDDAVAMCAHLDAALVVVDSGNTEREQLVSCMDMLKDVNILGYVLNGAPDSECHIQATRAY